MSAFGARAKRYGTSSACVVLRPLGDPFLMGCSVTRFCRTTLWRFVVPLAPPATLGRLIVPALPLLALGTLSLSASRLSPSSRLSVSSPRSSTLRRLLVAPNCLAPFFRLAHNPISARLLSGSRPKSRYLM